MDALLSASDPEAAVAATDALELYEIVHEVGLEDAMDLAVLATPAQVQTFADLDCWRRDQFQSEKLRPWLEVLLRADDSKFRQHFEQLDEEMLPLFLQEHLIVHLAEEDEPAPAVPNEEERPLRRSPDGAYWIQYPADDDLEQLCRRLVDRLYDALDVKKAWMMLEATRWELRSQMESKAYHFRSARLEDYGFRRHEEAIEIYAPVDPAVARRELAEAEKGDDDALDVARRYWLSSVETPHKMPRAMLERLKTDDGEASFLERCLARVDDALWPGIEQQLLTLANMAASADLIEPSDREALATHFGRVVATLNIGLEFIARHELTRGELVLVQMPLRRVFQVGNSLLLKLQRQAQELVGRGNLTVTDDIASLLGDEDRDVLEALLAQRPKRSTLSEAHFTSHEELESTAQRLTDIAFKELLFYGVLAFRREELESVATLPGLIGGPEGVTFSKLFGTLVLNSSLEGRDRLQPFTPGELPRDADTIEVAFEGWDEEKIVPAEHPAASAIRAAAIRFATGVKRTLLEELTNLDDTSDARYVSSVLVLSSELN